jgi:hypothetical protein
MAGRLAIRTLSVDYIEVIDLAAQTGLTTYDVSYSLAGKENGRGTGYLGQAPSQGFCIEVVSQLQITLEGKAQTDSKTQQLRADNV